MPGQSHNPPRRWPYLCLAVLFVVAIGNQIVFTADVVRSLRGEYSFPPFGLGAPWPTVTDVHRLAKPSGLQVRDRIISIDGRTPRGYLDLRQALHGKYPGEILRVVVDREGATAECRIKLWAGIPLRGLPALSAFVLMPWFCLTLGFWVAAVRPRDPRAWVMLVILLGLSQLQRAAILDPLGWPAPIAFPLIVYLELVVPAWAICMMLFGLYFPHRGRIDRGMPWLKWISIASLSFIGVWAALRAVARAVSFQGTWMLPPNPIPGGLQTGILFATVSLFFAGIGEKYRDRSLASDDRRRLKVLYLGCTAAMTPSFLRFLYAWIVLHRDPVDDAFTIWANAAEMLFPLTLAYVIVVQRAMDARMVVRQGLQYAFARQGVVVMQLVVMAVIAGTALNYAESHRLNYLEQSLVIALGVAAIVQVREQADRVRRWVDRRFFREAFNAEQILSELGEQVRTIFDRDHLLETVARKISESLHVDRIAVLLRDGASFRTALATGYPAPLELSVPEDAPAVNRLSGSREPVAVDEAYPVDDALHAELLLPLASRKELLGFISLGPKKSEEPYSPSDANLLRTVAAQTGLALENTRLSEAFAAEVAQREMLTREIQIAHEVQQRLFPQSMPEVPALEYAGHCRPARGVGGDYYDFLALSSGRLGLAIGDVSGKGIPAALLMASLQASVRGQSQTDPGHVAELMTNVNRLVCDATPENRYATFFYAQFDPSTRRFVYTNGGHNPPMVLRGGEVLRLENGGPPVGLFRFSRYQQDQVELQPGDVLVLFTDGISEAENPGEEEWGEDALVAAVRACGDMPPGGIITRVMEAADAFAAGAPQHDDMTLVVARVLASMAPVSGQMQ